MAAKLEGQILTLVKVPRTITSRWTLENQISAAGGDDSLQPVDAT
jgi:hypothetical protein